MNAPRWTKAELDAFNRRRNAQNGAVMASECPGLNREAIRTPGALRGDLRATAIERPTTAEERLNKTETEWLRILRSRGEDVRGIEDTTLRLADHCRYTPDLRTVDADGHIVFWEVKGGFIRDDARAKLHIAARTYPEYRFILAQKKAGTWTETEIKP